MSTINTNPGLRNFSEFVASCVFGYARLEFGSILKKLGVKPPIQWLQLICKPEIIAFECGIRRRDSVHFVLGDFLVKLMLGALFGADVIFRFLYVWLGLFSDSALCLVQSSYSGLRNVFPVFTYLCGEGWICLGGILWASDLFSFKTQFGIIPVLIASNFGFYRFMNGLGSKHSTR
ncbi:hypothetical protein Ancab_000215 [Ancistrocladus abbreviatus]